MAQPTVTVKLRDTGGTTFSLTVPIGATSEQYIRGIVKQGCVSPGDGKTFYPISYIASLIASAA